MGARAGQAFAGVWVPEGLVARLDEVAAGRGVSRSDVIRECLARGLEALEADGAVLAALRASAGRRAGVAGR